MSNTILPKRKATAGSVPGASDLQAGELAVNTADGRLYTELANGTVVNLAAKSIEGQAIAPAGVTASGALAFVPATSATPNVTGQIQFERTSNTSIRIKMLGTDSVVREAILALAPLIHPEASDWSTRVTTNGGSVSSTTLTAVSDFCYAIDSAGIRDRFYRLNLFCGTGLSACLVPLFRGQSLNGTQLGNTTDTNNGPFVAGDYTETGTSGGLVGDGSTKFLATGMTQSAIGTTGHASIYHRGTLPSASAAFLRASDGVDDIMGFDYSTGLSSMRGWWGTAGTAAFGGSSGGHWLVTRTAANALSNYRAGSSVSSDTTNVTLSLQSVGLYVFASNQNGTASLYSAARLQGYSLGLSMTAAQAASFNTAMVAFQTALTRN